MKLELILIATMLFVGGCGGGALQSKPEEVSTLSQGKGVVIGSIVLKTRKESAAFPIALSEKKWYVYVRPVDEGCLSEIFPPAGAGRGIDIKPDGKEVPFVSVLSAGVYRIVDLSTLGVDPNFDLLLGLEFSVAEKKKTYIGRLVITIPSHVNMLKTFVFEDKNVSIDIEDAQTDTVALLSGEYGTHLAEGLQKDLITAR